MKSIEDRLRDHIYVRDPHDDYTAALLQEATDTIAKLRAERETYLMLSGIGAWHNECRPNRWKAAREIEKSQSVINKLADKISAQAVTLEQIRALNATWQERERQHEQDAEDGRAYEVQICRGELNAILSVSPPDGPVREGGGRRHEKDHENDDTRVDG